MQLHLHLKVKCPDPDVWKYPFNRRALSMKLTRKQAGHERWRLLAVRPKWAGDGYHEDNSVLTVKWARSNVSPEAVKLRARGMGHQQRTVQLPHLCLLLQDAPRQND